MLEFETFVYLDVQKTGSSFVTRLLKEFCSEPIMAHNRHGRVGERYDTAKFHFVTVRDPYDQYISLYSHGCGGNGGLARRLNKKGMGHLYDSTWDGFRRWLKFVLKPETAKLLDADYGDRHGENICNLIGFQTYRYLELALSTPFETLAACATKDEVREAYRKTSIVNATVHHESFAEDLEELLVTKLRHAIKDIDGAIRHLREAPKVNASDRIDAFEPDPSLGRKTEALFDEREWLLKELFDY